VYAAAASKTFFTELEGAHISTLRSPGLVCGLHAFDRGDGSALQLNVGRRHLFGTKRWNVCFKPCNDSIAGWTRCAYDEWLQRVQAIGGWVENGNVFYPERQRFLPRKRHRGGRLLDTSAFCVQRNT
jgi:hypothetical protein